MPVRYEVSFKQIAGLLARRIVCNLKVGDRVERGQRMGLIKFGSRVDVLIPAEANLKVKTGSRVRGGSTVLAVIAEPARTMPRCGGSGGLMADGAPEVARRTQMDGETPAQPRDVCSAVAVYGGQYCCGILRDYAEHSGVGGGPAYFDRAALAIGFAVLFDGVDGMIARMTNTASDFGKELDSLADVITFGVAPSLLAYIWGFRMLPTMGYPQLA